MLLLIPVLFHVYLHVFQQHIQGYARVFEEIRNRIHQWSPNLVLCDFEAAEISAVREAFPQAVITGLYSA